MSSGIRVWFIPSLTPELPIRIKLCYLRFPPINTADFIIKVRKKSFKSFCSMPFSFYFLSYLHFPIKIKFFQVRHDYKIPEKKNAKFYEIVYNHRFQKRNSFPMKASHFYTLYAPIHSNKNVVFRLRFENRAQISNHKTWTCLHNLSSWKIFPFIVKENRSSRNPYAYIPREKIPGRMFFITFPNFFFFYLNAA